MVEQEWIKQKIDQFEQESLTCWYKDIRQKQLIFLKDIYNSGMFTKYHTDYILEKLILIYYSV